MELLDIQPRELTFTFQLKKQSSCSMQLFNKSDTCVAFKVKTTSPKTYCVRPNTGVILPKSKCDFTVTMQACQAAPPDMQLKDKFLVQSTVVPMGTTDEDIVPSFFSKERSYVEEHKLRVVLVSQPHSPVLQLINGGLKQEPNYDPLILKESPVLKDHVLSRPENLHSSHIADDAENLKLKLDSLEMKLSEANKTIIILREEKGVAIQERVVAIQEREKLQQEMVIFSNALQSDKTFKGEKSVVVRERDTALLERNWSIQERDKLQHEMILLRRKCDARVRVGFPFLFVVFVAIVAAWLGHLLHT